MAISIYNQHTHTYNAMGCIAHSIASGKKLRSEYWLILSLITIQGKSHLLESSHKK